MDLYTLLNFKWITGKALLTSTEHSAQCYVGAWLGGEFGGEGTRVCVTEALCCLPATVTTSLSICTPI